jgi:hypothetical protein
MATTIVYREFHDVPRVFVACYNGLTFVFDCPFDDDADDYPDEYHVYLMPELSPSDLDDSWVTLARKSTCYLGTLPIDEVQFDSTRRFSLESDILDQIIQQNELR